MADTRELRASAGGSCAEARDDARGRAAALAEGLRPLRLSAAEQVAKGITTIEEVLSVLPTAD